MKKRTKKIIVWGLCCILLASGIPYEHLSNSNKAFAATDTFTVTPKKDATFFVNQVISISQFDLSLTQGTIDENNISISPSIFTSAGKKELTISYDTGSIFYQQKISIEVNDVVADHLELSSNNITLVKNQPISPETLPDVYLCYSDGTKKIVTDYTTDIDWTGAILKISWNRLTITQKITVTENKLSYIQVSTQKNTVPINYEFVKDDFVVTAYFTDGTNMVVTDYQIQPYTLTEGKETIITIKYLNVISSVIVKTTDSQKAPTPTAYATMPGEVVTTTPGAVDATPTPNTTVAPTTDVQYTISTLPKTKIILEKSTITQGIGEKVKIPVKTKPNVAISMVSKNKKIATVSKNGYVKGIKSGKTKIVIKAGSAKATIGITVYPAPSKIGVTSKLSSSTEYMLKQGSTCEVPIYFNKGAYSNKITFHSSNPKVASVTNKGKITAKKIGKTIIRISTFNHKKASVKVIVTK